MINIFKNVVSERMMLYDTHASIGVIFIWQCPSPSYGFRKDDVV